MSAWSRGPAASACSRRRAAVVGGGEVREPSGDETDVRFGVGVGDRGGERRAGEIHSSGGVVDRRHDERHLGLTAETSASAGMWPPAGGCQARRTACSGRAAGYFDGDGHQRHSGACGVGGEVEVLLFGVHRDGPVGVIGS